MAAADMFGMLMGGVQMMAQNSAINKRISARNKQAKAEVEELTRQKKRDDTIAAEKKSDRAREFDIQLGTLLAAAADGGVTKAGLARSGAAAGFIAGLDKARIESNRQEGVSQKRAHQIAILDETAAANSADRETKTGNMLSFFGNAAGTLFQSAYSSTPNKVTPTKRVTSYDYNYRNRSTTGTFSNPS